jgi:predicted pyridoxine 5'-phosphate oxidase superfamily flavin-nucleotide-binding protein
MMKRYATDEDFLRETEHAPVIVDQWQLEKLALVTQRNEVLYAIPGVPADYRSKTWGRSYADPQEAVEALCAGLKPGARIAIVPEGPYVLAQAGAEALAEQSDAPPAAKIPAQVV